MGSNRQHAGRALFLAAIMVLSVVAMGVAFSGTGAAQVANGPLQNPTAEDVQVGQESVTQTVTVDVIASDSPENITFDPTMDSIGPDDFITASPTADGNLSVEGVTVSDEDFNVSVSGNVSTDEIDGTLTVEVVYNTTGIPSAEGMAVGISNEGGATALPSYALTVADSIHVAPNNGNSIQYAVNNVSEEGTVTVGPGTYEESVTFRTKGVTLVSTNGPEETTIVGSSGPAINVTSSNVTIDGFNIAGPTDAFTAIEVSNENADDLVVVNNEFTNQGDSSTGSNYGLHINADNVTDVTFENNVVSGYIMGVNADKQGIHNLSVVKNEFNIPVIEDDTTSFAGSGLGVQLYHGNDLQVTNNTFTGSLDEGNESLYKDPTVTYNHYAVVSFTSYFINSSNWTDIDGNVEFRNNEMSNLYLGASAFASGGEITDNYIHDNYIGFQVGQVDDVYATAAAQGLAIEQNDIVDNTLGIWVQNFVKDGIHATNNNLVGNAEAINNTGDNTFNATANWWGEKAPNFESQVNDLSRVTVAPWLNATLPDGELVSVRNIDYEKDYPTIQRALNEVEPNDTVIVPSGSFEETVTIGQPNVTLQAGDGQVTINASGTGNYTRVVEVIADNVTVSGFTITGGGHGIYLDNVANGEVVNNQMIDVGDGTPAMDDGDGVALVGTTGSRIANNVIQSSDNAPGIYLNVSPSNIIEENDIWNNDGGINLQPGSTDNVISGNNISVHNNAGISVIADGTTIQGNTLEYNKNGVAIDGNEVTGNTSISENNIQRNTQNGISAWGSNAYSIQVSFNSIKDNGNNGVGLWGSGQAFIIYNDIVANDGDGVKDGSEGSVVAPLNWWGSENGPIDDQTNGVSGTDLYDPFLTAPGDQVDAFGDGETIITRQFASDLFLQEGVNTLAFPAPSERSLNESVDMTNVEAVYVFDNVQGSWQQVTDDQMPQALDVYVMVVGSGEPADAVMEFNNTREETSTPNTTAVSGGWNLVSPSKAGSTLDDAFWTQNADIKGTITSSPFESPWSQPFRQEMGDATYSPFEGYWTFIDDSAGDSTIASPTWNGMTVEEFIENVLQTTNPG